MHAPQAAKGRPKNFRRTYPTEAERQRMDVDAIESHALTGAPKTPKLAVNLPNGTTVKLRSESDADERPVDVNRSEDPAHTRLLQHGALKNLGDFLADEAPMQVRPMRSLCRLSHHNITMR